MRNSWVDVLTEYAASFVASFISFFVIVFFAAILFAPIYWGYVEYHFNKSDCSVWVDNEMVYNGKCHFVSVEPVGEYGNSKRVAIFQDVRKWHQVQKYISENVQIKESVK